MSNNHPIPLACDLTAIEAGQRDQHQVTTEALMQLEQQVRELETGCALHLPDDSTAFLSAAESITPERLGCPFFNFALEADQGRGPFWLTLAGGEGVKGFLHDNVLPLISAR